MLFKRHKTDSFIGFEIHADEIRLLHLKKAGAVLSVANCVIAALPPGTIVDGKFMQADLIQAIAIRVVREAKLCGSSAAICLPAADIITKKIKQPLAFTELEREADIYTNAELYLLAERESISLDFLPGQAVDTKNIEVLLVAARKEQLLSYIMIATHAGLVPTIADIDSYALARAILWSSSTKLPAVLAILEISFENANFIVIAKDQVIFNQSWYRIRPEQLIVALKRALKLCVATHADVHIADLMVTGKTDLEHTALAEELSLRPHQINPFNKMTFESTELEKTVQPVYSRLLTCCGLALRGLSS